MNKRIAALLLCMLLAATTVSAAVPKARTQDIRDLLVWVPQRLEELTADYERIVTREIYGKSELGRDLEVYTLRQPGVEKPSAGIMMTFVLHGYEEYFDQDGVYLAELAVQMIEHYCKHPDQLGDVELIIVPVANPDGMNKVNGSDSWFGRAQSRNIDMNRDFRNGYCMAKESQALRDLLKARKPQVLIDYHGWLECVIGDADLSQMMTEIYGLRRYSENRGIQRGYWTGYAHTLGLRTLLVEFKSIRSIDPDKSVQFTNRIIAQYAPTEMPEQPDTLPAVIKDPAWQTA